MDYKKEFIELLKTTNRQGIDDLVEELEDLGFFKAPASTKFLLNEGGGLVQHSLNVCKAAVCRRKSMIELDDSLLEALPKDSVIIASLLHDTCKADIYKPTMKKEKNRFGMWCEVPGYDVDYLIDFRHFVQLKWCNSILRFSTQKAN